MLPTEAAALRSDLIVAWRAMFDGRDPESLEADLDRLGAWFGPSALEARIIGRLDAFPVMRLRRRSLTDFDPPLLLGEPRRAVVTPEGRIVLQALLDTAPGDDVNLDPVAAAVPIYRKWSHLVVAGAFEVRAGNGPQLRPLALGLTTSLVALGAVEPAGALSFRRDMDKRAQRLTLAPLTDFARGVSDRSRQAATCAIWTWPMAHACKRFDGVRRRRDGVTDRVWLDRKGLVAAIDDLAWELTRRPKIAQPAAALTAVGMLRSAWRRCLPRLDPQMQLGPTAGEDLLPQLEESLEAHAAGRR